MIRRNLAGLLKLLATVGLLAWLSARVDWSGAIEGAAQIRPAVFCGALALNALALALMGVRWWLLLRCIWPELKFGSVFPSYYLGAFLNLVLPSGIGGDIARTLHLSWRGLHWPPLVSSMLLDKAVGLASVILVGSTAILLGAANLPVDLRGLAGVALTGLLVATALLFSPLPERGLRERLDRRKSRFGKGAARIIGQCLGYRRHAGVVSFTIVVSLASQTLVILAYYTLGRELAISLAPSHYFIFVPILFLATALPISIGGLGVREATLFALLTAAGAKPDQAAALALAYFLVLWISSLPGLLGLLKPRGALAASPPAEAH